MSPAIHFAVRSHRVEVTVRDPALAPVLQHLFPAYLTNATHDRSAAVDSLSICAHGGGYVVTTSDEASIHCSDFPELLTTFEYEVTRALLGACADLVQLHASGAEREDGAVLAVGPSGCGKSSLAAAWAAAGHRVFGDDIVFLDEAGNASPFKRLLKVLPNVLREVGLAPERTPFWSPESETAWYDPDDGPGWATDRPIRLLAFPQYRTAATTALEPVSKTTSLRLLLENVMATGRDRADAFDTLCRLAEQAPGCRVTFGSAADAARILAAPR